jgi:hypothetical protein
MATQKIKINRAPVLTLWAVVVGERLGYKREEALTLAKGLTGLTAQAHGRALGIFKPSEEGEAKAKQTEAKEANVFTQLFFGRQIPVVRTKEGIRAVSKGERIKPERVERYPKIVRPHDPSTPSALRSAMVGEALLRRPRSPRRDDDGL